MTLPGFGNPCIPKGVEGSGPPRQMCSFLHDKPTGPPGEDGGLAPSSKSSGLTKEPRQAGPHRAIPFSVQLHGRPRPKLKTRDVLKRVYKCFHIPPFAQLTLAAEVGDHGLGGTSRSGHVMALCP